MAAPFARAIRTVRQFFTRPNPVDLARLFDGAAGGRRGSGMETMGRINPEVSAAGASLRRRARYLAANNPWLSQAVANWVGALVGLNHTGFIGEQRAWKISHEQRKPREPFFRRSASASGACGA